MENTENILPKSNWHDERMNASLVLRFSDSSGLVHILFPSFYGISKHVQQCSNRSIRGRLCEEKVRVNCWIDSRTIRDPFSLSEFVFVPIIPPLDE